MTVSLIEISRNWPRIFAPTRARGFQLLPLPYIAERTKERNWHIG
jgi:hypothetical protein